MTKFTFTPRRWLPATALLGLTALILSACQMQMNFTLKTDDKVDGNIVIAMTQAEATSLEAMGMTVDSLIEQSTSDLNSSFGATTVEDYNQNGQTGKKLTFADVPLSQFDGNDEGNPTGEIKFSRDGDDFVIAGKMDMSSGDMAAVGVLASSLQFTMSVTFPGKVGETNGKVSGNTVTWKLEIGKSNDISARGSAKVGGGSSGGALILVIAVLSAAVIAVVVVLVLRRRKKPSEPVSEPVPGYPGQAPTAPEQDNQLVAPSAGLIPGIGQESVPPGAPIPPEPMGPYGSPTATAWQPCSHCGTPNPAASQFCGSCGQPSADAPSAQQPIPPTQPPVAPVPPVVPPTQSAPQAEPTPPVTLASPDPQPEPTPPTAPTTPPVPPVPPT